MRIPFPLVLAEIFLFFFFLSRIGVLPTLGFYFLPCLLGILILQIWGRYTIMQIQAAAMTGQQPGNKLLNAGAIFISGLCFLIPSFFLRILGVLLFLPGTRHFLIWKLKGRILQSMKAGASGMNFGGFSFRAGGPFGGGSSFGSQPDERDVSSFHAVLDVKPLEVKHTSEDSKDS